AFLLGFARTWRGGPDLDLGLSLIALSVAIHVGVRAARGEREAPLDLGGLSLLCLSAWSIVSLAFAVGRIRGFAPAPGFAYHTYPFNGLGLSSDEAILRTIIGSALVFTWFGLYEWARSADLDPKALAVAVFAALAVDAAALAVQRYFDPYFLLPAGLKTPIGRLNGVTSFCYALGDVTLALFLLLPAWGSRRGLHAGLTVGSLLLLVHALVASGSRGAALVMLATVLLWAAVRAVRLARGGRPRAACVSAAALVLLLAVAATVYRVTPADPVSPAGPLKEGIEREGLVGHLVTTRLGTYTLLFRVMAAYPLSGVGVGLFPAEVSKQRTLLTPEQAIADPYLRTSNAPNQFLNTAVELGLLAMIALVLVFVSAAVASWRHPAPGQTDRLVGLLGLAAELQFGPGFQTSEALVFFWLVVGLAAPPLAPASAARIVGRRATLWLLTGAVAVGLLGQLWSRKALAVESQWQRLRWRLNIGM